MKNITALFLFLIPITLLAQSQADSTKIILPDENKMPDTLKTHPSDSVQAAASKEVADAPPQYPGGAQELIKFINQNLRHPKGNKLSGIVYTSFVVDSTGVIQEIEVKKGLQPPYDQEAIRVIKLMPKWVPGREGGRNVRKRISLPIGFKK